MRTLTVGVVFAAFLLLLGSPVSADGTKVGVAVGSAIPANGIADPIGPTLAVSVWVARPIRGPFEWRAEFGREHLRLRDDFRSGCAAAGYYCDAHLGVTRVGGGLQFEPGAGQAVAPYAYVAIGLYHVAPDAEVADLTGGTFSISRSSSENSFGVAVGSGVRFAINGHWTVRAELRYSGFTYSPGTVNWASVITPALSVSAGF